MLVGIAFYEKLNQNLRKIPRLCRAVAVINTLLTLSVYIIYPAMLLWLYFSGKDCISAIFVPCVAFCTLSIVRYFINRPRPYQQSDKIKPLNGKKTVGKSMPSRHTFSVFIIAFTALKFVPILGIALLVAGVILSVTRVLLGVHFISDVAVAFLSAALFSVGLYI